jgi:hypothetical protein
MHTCINLDDSAFTKSVFLHPKNWNPFHFVEEKDEKEFIK